MRHNAFIYDSEAGFAERAVPFIDAGLEEGAAVLAVTTRSNSALLRQELGDSSDRVEFIDRDAWYVRPARTIAAYNTKLSDVVQGGAPSIRVVGEVQFGATPDEWRDWTAYEAISNRAFEDHPAWLLCPYDARVLPSQVIDDASRTHLEVLSNGGQAGGHLHDPEAVVRTLAEEYEPLPELRAVPPGDDLVTVRERLAAEMAAANVPKATALNMLVAVNEVAANAFEHGGGPAELRVGVVGGQFVCEVSDRGPGHDDPLAGYIPPKPGERRGAGLWAARQVTSRLELFSSPDGLTVRLWA